MSQSRFLSSSAAVLVGFSLMNVPAAFAGWTGTMNGSGVGKASANVVSAVGTGSTAANPTGTAPSAAVSLSPPSPSYSGNAPLPNGAITTDRALIKGLPGYIWQASMAATGGDRADNLVIQKLAQQNPEDAVTPDLFTVLNLQTTIIYGSDGKPLQLDVSAIASGGTAFLIRGLNSPNGVPTDDQLMDINPDDFAFFLYKKGDSRGLNSEGPVHFYFDFPSNVDTNTFYVTVDGLAVSTTTPDGGGLGFVFAGTVGAMALLRRLDRSFNRA